MQVHITQVSQRKMQVHSTQVHSTQVSQREMYRYLRLSKFNTFEQKYKIIPASFSLRIMKVSSLSFSCKSFQLLKWKLRTSAPFLHIYVMQVLYILHNEKSVTWYLCISWKMSVKSRQLCHNFQWIASYLHQHYGIII